MLLSHPPSAPDSSLFSSASFHPGYPSYPAYPHSFAPAPPSPPASDDEDDCCMVDAQSAEGPAPTALSPKRKLSFCETVLVLETHSKLDYDRSSCEMSELTQDDIHEVLEMRREFRRQTAAATRMHQEQQAHIARLHLAARAATVFSNSNAQQQHQQPAFTRRTSAQSFPAFTQPAAGLHPDPNGAVGLCTSSASRRAASFANAHMYGAPSGPALATAPADALSPQARDHLRRYYMLAHQQQHPGSLPAPLGALDAGSVPHIDTTAQRHQGVDIRLAAAAAKWASTPASFWVPPSPPASPDREGEVESECAQQQGQQGQQAWQVQAQQMHQQMQHQMQWTGGAWPAC